MLGRIPGHGPSSGPAHLAVVHILVLLLVLPFLVLVRSAPSVLSSAAIDDDTVHVEIPAHSSTAPSAYTTPPSSTPSSPASSGYPYPPAAPLPEDLSTLPRDSFPSVIWSAPFFSGGGYCSEAQSFVLALSPYLSSSLQVVQHGDAVSHAYYRGLSSAVQSALLSMLHTQLDPASAVSVCHSEPGAWHPALYDTSRCPPAHAAVTIGRTMFETDRLPKGWRERVRRMDTVWVPSAFSRDVFVRGGVDAEKVVVLPEPVDVDAFHPRVAPMEFVRGERAKWAAGAPRPYRFLSVFKWEERKGWPFLLRAYLSEFRRSEGTELWILTSAYHSDADFDAQIRAFIARNLSAEERGEGDTATVRLLKSGIPSTELPAVYAAADAFVLPSRGEGWGRPHVEAMAMARPVIATRWSGPSEYMSERNSFPLEHDGFDEIADGPFEGHRWARPSVEHLRSLMRLVYEDREEAERRGLQARRDMVDKYCPACVARLVLQELSRFTVVRNKTLDARSKANARAAKSSGGGQPQRKEPKEQATPRGRAKASQRTEADEGSTSAR